MGRQFIVVSTLIALSIFAADTALAQGPRKNSRGGRGGKHHNGNGVRRGGERVLRLSPEERQTFKRNAERWLKMDPQQRNILRERDRVLRQRMKNEAEVILRDSGLRLENGARAQFEERYLQERKRIEQSLRQEVEAKRQQQLPQLKERLKSEFQRQQSSPTMSVSPGGSANPRN